uniref:Uncharacterized protein n=1 Tax=Phytophthora fragariae TaxID=53985 RepID=A0A6A3DIE2_9STRA|nr:hypothetical protein PF009_g31645 [Phytophthora fragariae]
MREPLLDSVQHRREPLLYRILHMREPLLDSVQHRREPLLYRILHVREPLLNRVVLVREPLLDRVSLQALARSRGRVADWTNDGGRALHTARAIALSLWGLGRGCPIHDCDVARRGDEQVSEHLTDVVADTPANRTG